MRRSAPKGSAWTLAKKAYTLGRKLYGVINSELHFHDTTNSTSPSTSGTVAHITDIDQGDDVSDRNGRSILAKYVDFKAVYQIHASASASTIRAIVFWDSQNQGSTPTVAEVLATASVVGQYNALTEHKRFHVLFDRLFCVDTTGGRLAKVDTRISLGDKHHIYYEGTAGTAAGKGTIWYLLISTEATNTPSNSTSFRVHYYDN